MFLCFGFFFSENTLGDGPKKPRIRVNSHDTVRLSTAKIAKFALCLDALFRVFAGKTLSMHKNDF